MVIHTDLSYWHLINSHEATFVINLYVLLYVQKIFKKIKCYFTLSEHHFACKIMIYIFYYLLICCYFHSISVFASKYRTARLIHN